MIEMKKQIALVYGGNSAEHDISVASGKNVAALIDRNLFDVHEILVKGTSWSIQREGYAPIEMNKDDFSYQLDGRRVAFDKVFMMIHGTPGENGLMEAYFEMLDIPYTTCSSFVGATTFNKYACKQFLRTSGVHLAKDIYLRKGDPFDPDAIVRELGLPLFVKPCDGGSSFGVTKVKRKEDIAAAIEEATREWDSCLIEEFIEGREMDQGVYCDEGEIKVLPITEIITTNEFFDYEAKYLGKSDEVCPAHISEHTAALVGEATKIIYHRLGCKGFVRMDYIVRGDEVFFLEINTVPGFTKASIVPKQVMAAGMSVTDFLTKVINEG